MSRLRQIVAAAIASLALTASGAVGVYAAADQATRDVTDGRSRACWHDPDTGRTFGVCWRGRIHEDASGVLRSPTIRCIMPAEDGPPTADCRWRNR